MLCELDLWRAGGHRRSSSHFGLVGVEAKSGCVADGFPGHDYKVAWRYLARKQRDIHLRCVDEAAGTNGFEC